MNDDDPILTAKVTALLKNLGDSAEQVAAALLEGGVTGVIEDGFACPLTNYFRQRIPDARYVFTGESVEVSLASRPAGATVILPEACADFVCNFDNKVYPDLIKKDDTP